MARSLQKRLFPPGLRLVYFKELKKSYEQGNVHSLLEAFNHYSGMMEDGEEPIPIWIKEGILEALKHQVKEGKVLNSKGGVSANETALAKNRAVHAIRWVWVKHFQGNGMKVTEAIEETRKYLDPLFGSVDFSTIRTSYYKVEKAMKDPNEGSKYYIPSRQTLKEMGIFD